MCSESEKQFIVDFLTVGVNETRRLQLKYSHFLHQPPANLHVSLNVHMEAAFANII